MMTEKSFLRKQIEVSRAKRRQLFGDSDAEGGAPAAEAEPRAGSAGCRDDDARARAAAAGGALARL